MAKKYYTSPSGTQYTMPASFPQDSTLTWSNGSANGTITVSPSNGNKPVRGTYEQYMGVSMAPEERSLSSEYVQKHGNNVQQGIQNGGFQEAPSLIDYLKKLWGKVRGQKNGGTIDYLEHFN